MSPIVLVIDLRDQSIEEETCLPDLYQLETEYYVQIIHLKVRDWWEYRSELRNLSDWTATDTLYLLFTSRICHKTLMSLLNYDLSPSWTFFVNSKVSFWSEFSPLLTEVLSFTSDYLSMEGIAALMAANHPFLFQLPDQSPCSNQFLFANSRLLKLLYEDLVTKGDPSVNGDGMIKTILSQPDVRSFILSGERLCYAFGSSVSRSSKDDYSMLFLNFYRDTVTPTTLAHSVNQNISVVPLIEEEYKFEHVCFITADQCVFPTVKLQLHLSRLFCEEMLGKEYFFQALTHRDIYFRSLDESITEASSKLQTLPSPLQEDIDRGYVYYYHWSIPSLMSESNSVENDLYGYGRVVDPIFSQYYYKTDMHALYQIFTKRFLNSHDPLVTSNGSQAKFFVIPYDIARDVLWGDDHRSDPGCPHAALVREKLLQSRYWNESNGRNHVLIVSTLMTNLVTHSNCGDFLFTFCKYCVKVTIEEYATAPYFLRGDSPEDVIFNRDLTEGRFEEELVDRHYIIPVPYPSSFHFPAHWTPSDYYRHFYFSAAVPGQRKERDLLSVFAGTDLFHELQSHHYRQILLQECDKVGVPTCLWVNALTASPSDISQAYERSKFCLMPKGATFSRKAFLDALLAGCIPIVFHLQSAHFLYPIHLSISVASQLCYFYPLSSFLQSPQLFFQWMETMANSEEFFLKRSFLAQFAHRLQYSLWNLTSSSAPDDAFQYLFSSLRRLLS